MSQAPDFAETPSSKQPPLQWLPSSPCKKESISIPVTPTTDGQVTSSQSFTVPVSVNAVSDQASFALAITTKLCLDLTDIIFHKCKLLPSVGHVREFKWQNQTTEIFFSTALKLRINLYSKAIHWPQILPFEATKDEIFSCLTLERPRRSFSPCSH